MSDRSGAFGLRWVGGPKSSAASRGRPLLHGVHSVHGLAVVHPAFFLGEAFGEQVVTQDEAFVAGDAAHGQGHGFDAIGCLLGLVGEVPTAWIYEIVMHG